MENLEQNRENEQNFEKFMETIKEAIEKGKEIEISQMRSSGETITNNAYPVALDGNYLTIDAGGFVFDIEINSISEVKIVESEEGAG